jgi:leucyl aminopeptidase (aminopeptidase T)
MPDCFDFTICASNRSLHYVLAVNVTAAYFLKVLFDEQVSNTFHFTFTVSSDSLKNGLKIRNSFGFSASVRGSPGA